MRDQAIDDMKERDDSGESQVSSARPSEVYERYLDERERLKRQLEAPLAGGRTPG